jgi:hypothetical protein
MLIIIIYIPNVIISLYALYIHYLMRLITSTNRLISQYKPVWLKNVCTEVVIIVIFKSNNCDGLFTFWLMLHYPVHKR